MEQPMSATLTEAQLQTLLATARATWPTLALPPERFLEYVRARLPDGVPLMQAIEQLHAADLFLACACADGDAQALALFEEHYLGVIDPALGKLGFAPDVVAEVKQELRRRLLVSDGRPPEICDFAGRGNLRGWVRTRAVHAAISMARKARKETSLDENAQLEALLVPSNPELEQLKVGYREAFARAFETALAGLDERERMILRQHVIDGLTIDELGRFYRVHRATAARMLERARQSLLMGTRAQLGERLRARPSELDSILRLIRSRISVSLRGLMRRRRR
jgi:RNA polymerase sigma-70 factor (ECF subfamily)